MRTLKKTAAVAGMLLTAVPTAVFIFCYAAFSEEESAPPLPDPNRWWFGV